MTSLQLKPANLGLYKIHALPVMCTKDLWLKAIRDQFWTTENFKVSDYSKTYLEESMKKRLVTF